VFDIRKKGFLHAASSAFALRRLLNSVDNESVLVMPESTFRERFIGGVRSFLALPKADNIYKAHRKFLEENLAIKQHVSMANKFSANTGQRRVVICPYSRVLAKNIPEHLIVEMVNECIHSGFIPEVLLLEGEKLDQSTKALNVRTIPRSFLSLASALSEYSCIISADSLPGHLAEYFYIPVFVVKRAPNTYWLPLSAFDAQHWGVFDELNQLKSRLNRFLNLVNN
jgi:ADP-heptose:LPS heptosyltransferase